MEGRPTNAMATGQPKILSRIFRRLTSWFWLISGLIILSFLFALLQTFWPAPAALERTTLGFHEAVATGDYERVRFFLTKNAAWANKPNALGEYPLELVSAPALEKNTGEIRARIADLLLDYGANFGAESGVWPRTPLNAAVEGRWPETIRLFLRREGPRISQQERVEAIWMAMFFGTPDILELLIDDSPSIKADQLTASLSEYIQNAPGWKCPSDQPAEGFVRILLKHGANASAPGLLQNAIAKYYQMKDWMNLAAIKDLIAHGADVNAPDESGRTPLHIAALNGDRQMMKLLISDGARENAKDRDGKTPADLFKANARLL